MPAANDIRKGQVIKFNNEPHLVMETQHRTPGNLRAFVQIKMRNLRYGKALDQRFASTDTIEVLPTDKRTLEFSYADRDTYAFMDPESFEQIELSESTLGDVKNYLTPGGKVDVLFVDEKPLTVEVPSAVNLKVVESADGIKGDTEELHRDALEWSTTRGSRSGRVAWQFIQDLAGRLGVALKD